MTSKAPKWVPHRSAVPGSVKGTNDTRLSRAEHKALQQKIEKQFVDAVQAKVPAHMETRVKWYDNGHDLNVGVRMKDDHASVAWARVYLDDSGNVNIVQHDTSLDQKYRGKGYGGQMIDALIAGYKALGATKGDVPIHVNSNPTFWDHMSKKHGGIFDEE